MSHFPYDDMDAQLENEAAEPDFDCDCCGRPVRFEGICNRCQMEEYERFGEPA